MSRRNPWEDKLRAPSPGRSGSSGSLRAPRPGRSGSGFPRGQSSHQASGQGVDTGHGQNEIVVKVISWAKTSKGAGNVIAYIAEHGGKDDRGIFHGDGIELRPEDTKELLSNWDLKPDTENYSKQYREATPEERRAMPDEQKYYRRQTLHKVVSFPLEHKQVTDEQLHQFARMYIDPFTQEGHHAIYAIHRHQARPHIHIIMTSYGFEKNPMRLDQSVLHRQRLHAQSIAIELGLQVEATRRRDRKSLTDRFSSDKERQEKVRQLKALQVQRELVKGSNSGLDTRISHLESLIARDEVPSLTQKHDYYSAALKPPGSLIERQTPVWYQRHGVTAQAALLGRDLAEMKMRAAPPKPIDFPALGQKTNIALNQFTQARFEQPKQARASFLEMAAENPRTAFWYANHRPEVFGRKKDGPEIKISQQDVRISKKWREQVTSRLIDHLPRQPDVLEVIKQDNTALDTARRAKITASAYKRDLSYLASTGRISPDKRPGRAPEAAKSRLPLNVMGGMSKVKDLFGTKARDDRTQNRPAAIDKTSAAPEPKKPTAPEKPKPSSVNELEKQMNAAKSRDKGPGKGRER
jgi:hypothetical protein